MVQRRLKRSNSDDDVMLRATSEAECLTDEEVSCGERCPRVGAVPGGQEKVMPGGISSCERASEAR